MISAHYSPAETITGHPASGSAGGYRVMDEAGRTVSVPFTNPVRTRGSADQVRVRVRDLVRGLHSMANSQLAWLDDLGDDPVVLTRDFYEMFVACQQIRRAG